MHVYLLYSGIRCQFVIILKFDQLKYSTIRINNTDNESLWPLYVHSSGQWHADFLLLHARELVNHFVSQSYPFHTLLLCATSSNNLLPLLSYYPCLDLLISGLSLSHLVIKSSCLAFCHPHIWDTMHAGKNYNVGITDIVVWQNVLSCVKHVCLKHRLIMCTAPSS
jgi:hypothetical protein